MKITQKHIILEHLKTFNHITSIEAFSNYGVTRLSAVIFLLRKDGYDIDSEPIHITNRFGGKCTFAKYILRGDKNV